MVDQQVARLRLGHAVRGRNGQCVGREDLEAVLEVLAGTVSLDARQPDAPTVVAMAEELLRIRADARPVYAYLGDLHPELGTIGLILDHDWIAHGLRGVSRCDSGGLAGGMGDFGLVEEEMRHNELKELSSETSSLFDVDGWQACFVEEVALSYGGQVEPYVRGTEPVVSGWGDVRRTCIEQSRQLQHDLDRRLWTWECRLGTPDCQHFVRLVLSEEASITLDELNDDGRTVPDHVHVIREQPHAPAFLSEPVRQALLGAP